MSKLPAPFPLSLDRLREILGRQPGRDGAVRARDLAVVLGIKDGSWKLVVQRAVNTVIEQGYPIGADGDNYFLIVTEEDLEYAIAPWQRGVRDLERRIERLTNAYRPRQPALFEAETDRRGREP